MELPEPTDKVFPQGGQLKLFNRILDKAKLKADRDGKPRTAYSLRHTYICLRLMEGADIYQIAKNCRTSSSRSQKYPLDKHLYAQRHLVECCFSKLKQFRRVATRFEKTARNYRAVVTLAAIVLWLR